MQLVCGKRPKNHLTVLMCVKLAETDKKSLSVTVKLFIPRFFKNIEKFSVAHAANKKTWVTFNICEHCVSQVKEKKTEKYILCTGIHFLIF